MPQTPVYGFEYEHEDDVPGHSLRSPGPILAEQIEAEILRLDIGFKSFEVVVFDEVGSHAFAKANWPGLRAVRARVQAGGGGGAGTQDNATLESSSSGGGAGGQYAEAFVFENALANQTIVTVGDGGPGGDPATNGTPGGQSSFGNHAVAQGGPGGFTRSPSTGFRGSTGGAPPDFSQAVGDFVINGSGGGGGFSFGESVIDPGTTDMGMRGMGGASHLGGHTRVIRGNDFGASPGGWYGGGGSGQVSAQGEDGKPGGDGRQGVVLLEIFV